jgi:colanic acid/amylovoran biosynthesis glycosyltransferase
MLLPHMPEIPTLMLWPSVLAWRLDGKLLLDRKFMDGMATWCQSWPGRVIVAMGVIDIPEAPPFGAYTWDASEAAFELVTLGPDQTLTREELRDVDVLLASADDHRQLFVSALCEQNGVACIFTIEYTLGTRLALVRYSATTLFKKLKSTLWLLRNEFRLKRAIGTAVGLQSNGLPALHAYAGNVKNSMHYFDTRLSKRDVINSTELEERLVHFRDGHPIRLAFSGRLIAAKGADALIALAIALKQIGVAFTLDVFGSGDLEPTMKRAIADHGVDDVVRMNGPVDFDTVLVPGFKRAVDLFICCHRQGDPSCTYAETLGCGVPIAGFANESLRSLIEAHDIGWDVRIGDVNGLAKLISQLAADRALIARKSVVAMEFGRVFNVEEAFARRAEHCLRTLESS